MSSEPAPSASSRATLHDVARHAGVSHITVSRYFRSPEKLAPGTRTRVRASVEALHYVPNAAARSLVQGSSALLALLVADITNPFFSTLARGVEDEAQRHGYPLILGNTDETPGREEGYLNALVSHQINGMILAPTVEAESHLSLLHDRRIPFVLVDRSVAGVQADLVRGDTRAGSRALVAHFVEQGYTDVAFVGGAPELSSLQDRLSGYRDGMRAAGLAERVYLGSYLQRSGEATTRRLLADDALPEAILAANNLVAAGIVGVLREHGRAIPGDVAVACIDEVELSPASDAFLTVVRQPAFEMGRRAMTMLLERIEDGSLAPREVVLPTELIVRRSSIRP